MKLQQALHSNLIKRLQRMVFAGVSVSKENLPETDADYFYVKCLSPLPKAIQEAFQGSEFIFQAPRMNKQNKQVLASVSGQEVRNRLLVFRLRYWNSHLQAELIRIDNKEAAPAYYLIPVPYLQNGQTKETLERKLGNGYVSFLLPKHSHELGVPKFIWCDGRLYGNLALRSSVSSIIYWEQQKEVRYIDIDDWESYVDISVDDQLYFVGEDKYQQLLKKMEEAGKRLTAPLKAPEKPNQIKTSEKEFQFLQSVHQKILEKGLYIDETDIYNFHVCVKTNPITIVGGMPGIGKSQFVQAYAEALGLNYGNELLWISVSPSFQEPQDLLGYLHPNGTYMESETGFVRFLIHASNHPDQLHMVVFDEMNVSYIEHWFTSFLSLLELEEGKRELSLYKAQDELQLQIPPTVPIGNNIIFVGTVNFDDTTKELSDRLLDRVNMMTLKKLSFREATFMQPTNKEAAVSVLSTEFRRQWTNYHPALSVFTEEEIELLDLLHEMLQEHDPTKGVSFRTVVNIASYLDNIPRCEDGLLISREEALDLQIKQRILTKIRGMETVIGDLLDEGNKRGKSIIQLLQSPPATEVSAFTHSIAYLKKKARELELYGYAK
ncbi:MAG: AAA family ATPase [Ectobacillus sp.]